MTEVGITAYTMFIEVLQRVSDEPSDSHARKGVPRGADGLLPGHERQLVAVVNVGDLLVRELEREDRSPLVLTVELEERAVAHVATSGDGAGVGQLVCLLDGLTDRSKQFGLAVVDEATGQLVVVCVADQVESGRLEHHDLELACLSDVADDKRSATAVLVEQPLVPGLFRNHTDLEQAEPTVEETVVPFVAVNPARRNVGGVVSQRGLQCDVVHDITSLLTYDSARECNLRTSEMSIILA